MLEKVKGSFSHAPRSLALVYRASPGGTIAFSLLTLVAAVVPLGVAWIGKAIVDAVVARDRGATLRFVLVELALVASLALAQRGLAYVRAQLGARLGIDVNVTILEKALRLSLRHFEDPEYYDQLTRARREASSRPISMVTSSFGIVQNAITLAGYIALLIRFSTLAVVALVVASIPATVAEVKFSGVAFRMRNWRSQDTRKLNYLEYVLANDDHAKEVKLLGLGPILLERFKRVSEAFYEEDKKLTAQRMTWGYLLSLLGTGAFYGCYVVMALAAAAGELALGTMVLYVAAFRQGQQAFQAILGALSGMYEDNLYMSNLFAFLSIEEDAGPRPAGHTAQAGAREAGEGIVFEDVGFKYPGAEAWAVRHVDLRIAPGARIALVGHNGAGKTTLIKLLTRLYEPTEGRILLDGKDLRAWDDEALRARIGVVFQDFNQYQLKLRENVGFGSAPHLADDERLGRAIGRGGATEVVAKLSGGLDAQLGRWFKDGAELSGGQWQKVALARAFMREEADILILDEPTAALDAEAEHAVFERFQELAEGRTTIVISHRFPTVRMADRILVLDGGAILEEGSHDALVAKKGRYAKLFELQAQGYQ
ncbi:MAG TPA: ABC transporter ATP-binding protein [Minicystis sp.]|nr:ABC transporter ATP-binding protein [Minicystis sp.]